MILEGLIMIAGELSMNDEQGILQSPCVSEKDLKALRSLLVSTILSPMLETMHAYNPIRLMSTERHIIVVNDPDLLKIRKVILKVRHLQHGATEYHFEIFRTKPDSICR